MIRNYIRFGAEELTKFSTPASNILAVEQINVHEYLAITTKEIIKFEGSVIKSSCRIQLSAIKYIKEAEAIFGVTAYNSEFVIFQPGNVSKIVRRLLPLDQIGVSQIIYYPKSKKLLTIGSEIKVWEIGFQQITARFGFDPDKITIKHLQTYETPGTFSLLNPISIDYEEETFIILCDKCIKKYKLNGKQYGTPIPAPNGKGIPFSYLSETRQYVLYHPNDGICVYDSNGTLTTNFNYGKCPFISLIFMDTQHILCMDSNYNLSIVNLLTKRSVICVESERSVTRISLFNRILCLTLGNYTEFYELILPYKTFASNIRAATTVKSVFKNRKAARVVAASDSALISLLSPCNGAIVTSASASPGSAAKCVFYDRNSFFKLENDSLKMIKISEKERDSIFVCLGDGRIEGFDANTIPSKPFSVNMVGIQMCYCFINSKGYFATGDSRGRIHIYQHSDFQSYCTLAVAASSPKFLKYLEKDTLLYVTDENDFIIVDLRNLQESEESENGRVIFQKHYDEINCVETHNRSIYIGLDDGRVRVLDVDENGKIPDIEGTVRQHTEKVTGIGFGYSFWISSSLDGTVIFWDYHNVEFATVNVLIPLWSCGVLNGYNDVICGTDSDVIVITGKYVFGTSTAPEIEGADIFSKLKDDLDPNAIQNNKISMSKSTINPSSFKIKLRKRVMLESSSLCLIQKKVQFVDILDKRDDIDDAQRKKLLEEMNILTEQPIVLKIREELKSSASEPNIIMSPVSEPPSECEAKSPRMRKKKLKKEISLQDLIKSEEEGNIEKKKRKKHKKRKSYNVEGNSNKDESSICVNCDEKGAINNEEEEEANSNSNDALNNTSSHHKNENYESENSKDKISEIPSGLSNGKSTKEQTNNTDPANEIIEEFADNQEITSITKDEKKCDNDKNTVGNKSNKVKPNTTLKDISHNDDCFNDPTLRGVPSAAKPGFVDRSSLPDPMIEKLYNANPGYVAELGADILRRDKGKDDQNSLNYKKRKIKEKHQQTLKMPKRAASPPPIRDRIPMPRCGARIRQMTPIRRFVPKTFKMPEPCVVIDRHQVLEEFQRGRREFLPLVNYLEKQEALMSPRNPGVPPLSLGPAPEPPAEEGPPHAHAPRPKAKSFAVRPPRYGSFIRSPRPLGDLELAVTVKSARTKRVEYLIPRKIFVPEVKRK